RLALARPGDQARAWVLRLDAVAEPVRAGRRARLIAERLSQPVGARPLRVSVRDVAVGDLLCEVFGQVADAFLGVLAPREHALSTELRAERGHMSRLISRADRIQRLVPGLEDFAGGRVEIVAGNLIPDRRAIPVEDHGVGGGPPDLVVSGSEDL